MKLNEVINFCTLFDRNYLYKGLTLYHSLLKQCSDFTLWILCMDDLTFDVLNKLNLERAVLIRSSEFEDKKLKEAKATRTVAEYCWTCTPSLLMYVLRTNPSLDKIAYLDADLFFYSDPAPIYEEFGDKSIMIIEHRFPEHLKHLEENGIYNVQMLIFRNNTLGLECLQWWCDRCIEWCYQRIEDGKMGDQKYLDDWPVRFQGVHVLQHKGAGVALWNVMRYTMTQRNNQTFIDEVPLIFYHFHQFHLLKKGQYDYGAGSQYSLSAENIEYVYKPYIIEIEHSVRAVRNIDHRFTYGFKYFKKDTIMDKALSMPRRIKNRIMKMYGTGRIGT